ncbi:caspase-8-like [Vespula maculifrons]|uniref:Caspase-8-like n=1 Tax=Vespula maculifrons TaxID=7453 RepID=A0ABD2CWU4_VESMC
MSLVSDAIPHMDVETNMAKKEINLDILEKIENDLDIDDIISILFLMASDYKNVFPKVFELYCKAKEHGTFVIIEVVKENQENWEDRLLESICICNNRKVIKKLGLRYEDLKKYYLSNCGLYTKQLNPIAKCLYILCESLTKEETKALLHSIKEDEIFLSIDKDKKYEAMLEDIDQLELHLLYWMNIGYISIFSAKEGNLKDLLKHLNAFDDIKQIIRDLKCYERNRNISSAGTLEEATSFCQTNVIEPGYSDKSIRKVKKGLCVIINEINFRGLQYETRFGTTVDADALLKTFKGFGFTVDIVENLTKHEILSTIRNLSKQFGCDYDCIFLCILSHGYKGNLHEPISRSNVRCSNKYMQLDKVYIQGGIIAVDEKEVSIESISNAFCCPEFSQIIKIVIIQACQGKIRGKVLNHDSITTDGLDEPVTADITARMNFCIFMSTLQGFVSLRDKREGSWFIQGLCNILQRNGRKISFFKCVTKVIEVIQNKRGTINDDCIAQLPELLSCRLHSDFELPQYNP